MSAYATAQVVAEGGGRTAERAGEAVGLVAEAGDGAVCCIRRARPPGKDEAVEDPHFGLAFFTA